MADIDKSSKVHSVADALVKLRWFLGAIDNTLSNSRHFFRGEHRIGRPLLSRQGRISFKANEAFEDPKQVSDREVTDLKEFQTRWKDGDLEVHPDDASRFQHIKSSDSSWWSLMQHYDTCGNATRMPDVTASFLSGLYFSCVSWGGSIVPEEEGVLYLFHEGQGERVMFEGAAGEFEDDVPCAWEDMFRTPYDVPTLYIPGVLNERLKIQRGAFLFWHDFHKPFPGGLRYLVVSGDSKEMIVRELLNYGISPRLFVGGNRGEEAQKVLFAQLGLELRKYD